MKKIPQTVITGGLLAISLGALFIAAPVITADYYRGQADRVLSRLEQNIALRKAAIKHAYASVTTPSTEIAIQIRGLARDIAEAEKAMPKLQRAGGTMEWNAYYRETRQLSESATDVLHRSIIDAQALVNTLDSVAAYAHYKTIAEDLPTIINRL